MVKREIDKIKNLVRHIKNVQDNGFILCEKLIENGETSFARQLLANIMIHDNSKFYGIEWDALYNDTSDELKLREAIDEHTKHNRHHPEFHFYGIHGMSNIEIAEMICDWKSRSSEMGTSLQDWIDNEATKRFNFRKGSLTYDIIMSFVNMLLDPKFEGLKNENNKN